MLAEDNTRSDCGRTPEAPSTVRTRPWSQCSLGVLKTIFVATVACVTAAAGDSNRTRDALLAANGGAFEPLITAIHLETDPGKSALLKAREAASRLDEASALRALKLFFKTGAADSGLAQLAQEIHIDAAFAAGDYTAASLAAAQLRDWLVSSGHTQKLSEIVQTYTVAAYLAKVPRQKLLHRAVGEKSPAWRDKVGLTRTQIAINGIEQEAVLDTGANLSVVTRSTAKKLGLRMLEGAASVRSVTSDDVATHLGVADRIVVAGSVLSNVAFLVFDDAQLEMPVPGGYRIDAIIGFPVFRALGRVRFGHRDFTAERPGRANIAEPLNLRAIGSSLFVQALINGIPVALHLDTGANSSGLSARFARERPEVLVGLDRRGSQIAGAGNAMLQIEQALWKEIEITIAGSSLKLPQLNIQTSASQTTTNDDYGVLGKDVLGAFESFTLDFKNMRFQLGPPV